MHGRNFGGSFVGDDLAHVYQIAIVDRAGELIDWLSSRFVQPFTSGNLAYRPLLSISYALDWRLYGASPAGWRFTSLLLHFANGALLFLLIRRWARRDRDSAWAAALTAAAFIAFPFAGEATYWISGRADLLAAFFSILFLFSLDGRLHASPHRQAFRIVAFVGAVFSKESAVPLPLIAILIDAALVAPSGASAWADALRRIGTAVRDLWLVLAALLAYIALRAALLGTPFKVYADARLPSSFAEFIERLSLLAVMMREQADLGPTMLWPAVAAAIAVTIGVVALLVARVHPRMRALVCVCAFAALAYFIAPSLSQAAASYIGEGARNYYVPWIYAAMAVGLAASTSVANRVLAALGIVWCLVCQAGSLAQWHGAGQEMRRLLQAIPQLGDSIGGDQYALLLVPDHIGPAVFARTAQGSIAVWPHQPTRYLSKLAGATEVDLPQWKEHFASDAIAMLKQIPHFDARNFAGVFCWRSSTGRFVQIGSPGEIRDFDAWQNAIRRNAKTADCLGAPQL